MQVPLTVEQLKCLKQVRYMAYVLSVMSQLGKMVHAGPAAPFELGTRQLADIQWPGMQHRSSSALAVQSLPQPPTCEVGQCSASLRYESMDCLRSATVVASDRSMREPPGASDLRILLPGLHWCAVDGASVASSSCRKSEVCTETLMLLETVAWLSSLSSEMEL